MPWLKRSLKPVAMPARKPKPNLAELLAAAHIDPREGRDFLAYVLKKPTAYLLAHPETQLSPPQQATFRTLAAKRRRGVPFAYLTGQQGFYGLDFAVTKDVLIPRPETEQLVDWVLAHNNRKAQSTIIDVGTGSGCIAVTLAKYLPAARIIAADVSAAALRVAKKNARAHGVSQRISFRQGSLLTVRKPNEHMDLVVANLPYLTISQLKNLPHEPKLALHGGTRGLELIEKLIQQIVERGIPRAILEIDPAQERWIAALDSHLCGYALSFVSDLSHRTRFLTLSHPVI